MWNRLFSIRRKKRSVYSNQKRKDMNYTISMTDILLAVSVGCNLWFLFLLLYERIMETRLVRFFKGIAGLWRSFDRNGPKSVAAHEEVPTAKGDIIGKSRFKMASTRTIAAIPAQEAATLEKGCSWITLFIAMAPSLGFRTLCWVKANTSSSTLRAIR